MSAVFAVALQDERECSPPSSLALARERGAEVTRLRAELLSGALTLADVLDPVHPDLADMALIDVLRLTRASSRRRSAPGFERLGRLAVADRKNLLLRAGRASADTRAWVIEHGSKRRSVR